MSAPTLSQGLAVVEHASIALQALIQHVPLNERESAKKRVQFLTRLMDEFALSNLEDSPDIRTLHASVDAVFHKAEEDYHTATLECDEVLRSNDILNKLITSLEHQKSLVRKALEDVPVSHYAVGQSADPSVVDVQESSNVEIEAVADVAATHLPAADMAAADLASLDLPTADIAVADLPTVDLPSVDSPALDRPNNFLLKMFGERRHSNNPTIDRLAPTLIRASKSGGAITHFAAPSTVIDVLVNGTHDKKTKELLTRLERIPQELQDEVGNLILDPAYYYQRYCHKKLPRQVSFGTSVYEPGKIIKVFFTTDETLKMGSLSAVQADMDSQMACIPKDRPTYHHYIIYRSVSFQSLWLMEQFERFRHALTIQLYGCRYACWRTIVTIALPAHRKFNHVPHIKLLHYVDSTPSTIGDIRGMDFTILYVYLYDMVNANMISVKSIRKKIEDKAYLFDQFKDMYQDLQGYLMHRYRLPLELLEMAEDFDIKDHKPKDQGVALRLDGFELDTPAGKWQQIFENQYRYLKCERVNASWYKTGNLVICEKCRRALPALFSFDKNVLKPGENHEDPHPICRMCQLVPTCNGLLATAVNAYVPTTPKDAKEKRKPKFEDGDPHKLVASEDVDLSTWIVPESTGASMQVEQHLKYDATLFSPTYVVRDFPSEELFHQFHQRVSRARHFQED
ncbi:uncharacterized protein EAF02_001510 [Botrytis sinoallii]|uniref:uncharacterized protein n=1 Tax=Botrytis sinoallii TaxID=1463999 RepID=UPI0018FF460D|nr:uncharacterized protein EAF02_001510 [Botrytis sinoallii]KAF7891185.1 hypothetical protein EAF02_001510 [Botrytis sinoallii]